MKSAKLRELFLSYFENQGHKVVNSSPLVPGNDPTLLFTNAGMVQFKDVFLGSEQRSYHRAVSSQRCVRAGGKHNDLENVGYTARHHTFFEMLGNFSFGDYFKREAIQFAWKFLTEELKLPHEKLWVTIYNDDQEAADIWLNEMGVSAERFSRCGEKDNFWSMGDTGPCGPCSEIFYDHGEHIWGGPPGSPEEDGDRYVEIWNLVFMQYDRDASGKLTLLPKPSVDTGMGLERIAAVMQGVQNNYDIDLFQTLILALYSLTSDQDRNDASFKVVVDHIRSCAFLILDGVLPGNEGQGYVLRRIIRRAVRHGHKLGLSDSPFFYKLVSTLCDVMGQAYPDLIEQQAHIEKIINQEEEQFSRTLSHGLKLLEADISDLEGTVISGDTAFKLFDTYGFPFDLTADIARERVLSVDKDGFDQAMQAQREASRAGGQFKNEQAKHQQLDVKSGFSGYDLDQGIGKIRALLNANGEAVESLNASQEKVGVVLNQTPFYAESGGQVGDTGTLTAQGILFEVTDTQKNNDAIMHYGVLSQGKLALDNTLDAQINVERRSAIRANHSATHLVHAALRAVLGKHVLQKGSLVTAEKARFDFSHFEPVSRAQLHKIDMLVNQQIRANNKTIIDEMTMEQAQNSGAMALFGEKYDDTVRVLRFGDFSKELCGGTHVHRTGDIGLCRIVQETGIASGVRRVEFITGAIALDFVLEQENILQIVSDILHSTPTRVSAKVSVVLEQQKQLEKKISHLEAKAAQSAGSELLEKIEKFGDYSLLMVRLDDCDPKSLRSMLDGLKDKLKKAAIALVAVNGKKMNVIAGLTKDAINELPDAKFMVQTLCGKGGGRPDMAQGGGLLPEDLEARFNTIREKVTH